MAEAANFVTREVYEADQRRIDERLDRVFEKLDNTVKEMKRYVETTVNDLRQDNELFKWEIKAQNSEFRENVTRDL